jgi:peroxiredoxin
MQSKYRLLIAAILVLIASVYLVKQSGLIAPTISQPSQAQVLLNARFNALDGSEVSLKTWQNKIIVLNFWATWCPPCREEMPELSKMQDEYKNQNLVIIGLSTEDLDTTKNFIAEHPVSYPVLAGDMQAMTFAESLGNNQSILPYTVVIDEKGQLVKTFFGRVNQTLLEKTITPLLKKPSSSN